MQVVDFIIKSQMAGPSGSFAANVLIAIVADALMPFAARGSR